MKQIAVGAVELDAVEAEALRAPGRRTKPALMRSSPALSSACGGFSPGAKAMAEGATVCQPPGASGGICLPPSHGTLHDAFRPACASWSRTLTGEVAANGLHDASERFLVPHRRTSQGRPV